MTTERADDMFDEADTNRDGVVDRHEFRNWVTGANDGVVSSSQDTTTSGVYVTYTSTGGSYDRNRYNLYGSTAISSDFIDDAVVHTNSLEETNRYLERTALNVYHDPNPQIVQRGVIDAAETYEQRILVRYLQPPELPPPGPLIIKEVRPPQPPPPPPLIIHQHAVAPPMPPPLILRERPPTPPPPVPSETVIKTLPALPAPPRSVIIHRFAAPPQRPRDIIIERWLPYGARGERQKIVESAPPPVRYPEPRTQIIVHDTARARVVRHFKKIDVIRADPADYVARYGGALLDSSTLVQRARDAGVFEDISTPAITSNSYTYLRGTTTDNELFNEILSREFSITDVTHERRNWP